MRDFVAVVQRMSQEDLSAWSSTAGSKMVGTRVRTKPENPYTPLGAVGCGLVSKTCQSLITK